MNNYRLLITLLYVTLCAVTAVSQQDASIALTTDTCHNGVLTVDEMFRLADINSKQLRPLLSGVEEAEAGISVASYNSRL